MFLACRHNRLEMVRLLLDRGGDPNNPGPEGITPVYSASNNGHLEMVRLLLDRGADVDTATTGITPLLAASRKGYLQLVQLLASSGAATTNAATRASSHGHVTVAAFLRAVAGWAPLKIAVACRLHSAAKSALKLGRIEPAFTTATELAAVAAAPPGSLWPESPAVCGATAALAKEAASVWSPARHFLYHGGVRISVHTMLLIAERLRRRHSVATHVATLLSPGELQTLGLSAPLPPLPSELWRVTCSFVLRSHWAVPRR